MCTSLIPRLSLSLSLHTIPHMTFDLPERLIARKDAEGELGNKARCILLLAVLIEPSSILYTHTHTCLHAADCVRGRCVASSAGLGPFQSRGAGQREAVDRH